MTTFNSFKTFTGNLENTETKMPVLFIGHGSPMNGIEDNEFSKRWSAIGQEIQQPKAVLCISAHWFTRGTHITEMEQPRTIHDFYGFPRELHAVQYPAPGDPQLAKDTAALVHKADVGMDHEWGLDHGTWTVVRNMYPKADIPVVQFSIDYTQKPSFHYELAQELASLRNKGVLIIGSGNMVHNLPMMSWNNPNNGYDWAIEMNERFKQLISNDEHQPLIDYGKLGKAAQLSIPTPEHYLPLLYSLALKNENEPIIFFNDELQLGSVSMTSVKIGE